MTDANVPRLKKSELRIKLGTINASTLREKEEELVEVMGMRGLDVLALAETRLKGRDDRTIHENHRLISSGKDGGRHGVAFLLNENIASCVEQVKQVNERIIGLDLKLETGVSLIQVYAPQQGRPAAEKEEFYRLMQQTMDEMKYQQNTVICGDLNGHIGRNRVGYKNIIGAHSIGERNVEGQRILDFATANNLSVMNTYFQHRDSQKWTWYRYNHQVQAYTQKSMIDMYMTNNKALFLDVKSVPSCSMDADHRLVMANIRMKKPGRRKMAGVKRYKLGKLREPETKDKLKRAIEEKCGRESGEGETEVLWSAFKRKLVEAANEILGEKNPTEGKRR